MNLYLSAGQINQYSESNSDVFSSPFKGVGTDKII